MKFIFCFLTITFLTSCTPSTEQMANQNGFKHQYIQTSKFKLTTYQKITQPGHDLDIYIEGDGNAWSSRHRASSDPSPRSATTMQLATLDSNPNVVYIARPCQYSPDDLKTVCEEKFWTYARYSLPVLQSLDNGINEIKQQTGAERINLIGYSGGGALVVLLAAQRTDIASIKTIAGNLDLLTMEKIHNTSALTESLDPLTVATRVKHIPQIHFAGAKDSIVPPIIANNFVHAAQLSSRHIKIIADATHNKNWDKHWPELLKYVP